MLELIIQRPIDKPILDQSQGQLKYIVLDEAHTYVGSKAAELALLLRRVIHALVVTSTTFSLLLRQQRSLRVNVQQRYPN